MKKHLNKKGYTLTYVIVIIGLLLILTGSVTFISYYNLKTSRIGGRVNTSFYANDGALEEALTELNRHTYNAEVEAWDHINSKSYLADSSWIDFLDEIYKDVNKPVDGITIEKANNIISRALQGEFEKTFFNELYATPIANHVFFNAGAIDYESKYPDYTTYQGLSNIGTQVLSSNIIDDMEEITFDPTGNIVSPEGVPIVDVFNIVYPTPNEIDLSVSSDGTYHKYNKKIQADLKITAPKYAFSVAMLTKNIIMYRNELTNPALVTNGDLVFVDGTSIVDGDVYAYGNFVDSSDNYSHIDVKYNQPRDQYGGVVIGYRDEPSGNEVRVYGDSEIDKLYSSDNSSTVTINGDLSTRNSVKLETTDSILTVGNNVYANAFYIRQETEDTLAQINNNLYLYSDLYISGTNSKVEVGNSVPADVKVSDVRDEYQPGNGEIWGLYSENLAVQEDYTRTGSIIISSNADNPTIVANALYLHGVIRYDVKGYNQREPDSGDDKVAYKSGESFTTYNNAQYYQTLLSDDIYQSGVFSFLSQFTSPGGVGYDMISFDALQELNQVSYRRNHYFTMGYLASLDDENLYKKVSEADKKILQFRRFQKNADNQFFGIASPGLLAFGEVGETEGKVYNNNRTPLDDDIAGAMRDKVLRRDSDMDDEAVDEKINVLGYSANVGGVYQEKSFFNNWLDISFVDTSDIDNDGDTTEILYRDSVTTNPSTPTSVALFNNDSNVDIYINYPLEVAGAINLQGRKGFNEMIEGTIVTRGNVYVYADVGETLEFTGNIISEKNIYCYGPGEKTFVHDEDKIYEAINKDPGLKELYMTDFGRQLSIANSKTSLEVNFSVSVGNNQDENNKITINYVSDMSSDGTSIIDSNSITINSWTETD
ncbi:MAG: hypothetical protein JEZ08_07170 [Clostridiales bacterium]|nr:hypothetical protein [Clostridiales bacterium]